MHAEMVVQWLSVNLNFPSLRMLVQCSIMERVTLCGTNSVAASLLSGKERRPKFLSKSNDLRRTTGRIVTTLLASYPGLLVSLSYAVIKAGIGN